MYKSASVNAETRFKVHHPLVKMVVIQPDSPLSASLRVRMPTETWSQFGFSFLVAHVATGALHYVPGALPSDNVHRPNARGTMHVLRRWRKHFSGLSGPSRGHRIPFSGPVDVAVG